MSEPYAIASLAELQAPTTPDSPLAAHVRLHFGISAFGINAWTATKDGQTVIGEHDEIGPRSGRHEELYFVASGHATFIVDGDEIDAPTGTYVFVRDPELRRKAVAKEAGTTVVAAGGRKGEAFAPTGWEHGARALRHWHTGDFEAAVAELSQIHAEQPDNSGVLYNLACAESMSGRRGEALAHLRQAIELDEDFRELAEKDSDFDPIRADPEFASAVAGQADATRPGA